MSNDFFHLSSILSDLNDQFISTSHQRGPLRNYSGTDIIVVTGVLWRSQILKKFVKYQSPKSCHQLAFWRGLVKFRPKFFEM